MRLEWERARCIIECMAYVPEDNTITLSNLVTQMYDALDEIARCVTEHHATRQSIESKSNDYCARADDDANDCIVCRNNALNVVITIPCRHFLLYSGCGIRNKNCPVCRAVIWIVVSVRL